MTTFEDEFYGEKKLRWFQVASKTAIAEALEEAFLRILVVHPTGAGKTLTIASSLSDPRIRQALGVAPSKKLRVLFVAHTHRILSQGEQTFVEDSNVEVIPQSMFTPIPNDIIKQGWDVAVLDESHHEACLSFQLQLEQLGDRPIIGLTATPDRPDGQTPRRPRHRHPVRCGAHRCH